MTCQVYTRQRPAFVLGKAHSTDLSYLWQNAAAIPVVLAIAKLKPYNTRDIQQEHCRMHVERLFGPCPSFSIVLGHYVWTLPDHTCTAVWKDRGLVLCSVWLVVWCQQCVSFSCVCSSQGLGLALYLSSFQGSCPLFNDKA